MNIQALIKSFNRASMYQIQRSLMHNTPISKGYSGAKRVLTCMNEETPHVDDTLRSLLGGNHSRLSITELEKFIETNYGTKKMNLEGDIFLAKHAINAFEMAKNKGFSVEGLGIRKDPYINQMEFRWGSLDIAIPKKHDWDKIANALRNGYAEGDKLLSSGTSPEAQLLHECCHLWHYKKDPELYCFSWGPYLTKDYINDFLKYKYIKHGKINDTTGVHRKLYKHCKIIDDNQDIIKRETCTYPIMVAYKDRPFEFVAETLATAITHNARISDYSEPIQKLYNNIGGPITKQIL